MHIWGLSREAAGVGECLEAVGSELSFFTLPNCFELFGFDLLVDDNWHLWLLEVPCPPLVCTKKATLPHALLVTAISPFYCRVSACVPCQTSVSLR